MIKCISLFLIKEYTECFHGGYTVDIIIRMESIIIIFFFTGNLQIPRPFMILLWFLLISDLIYFRISFSDELHCFFIFLLNSFRHTADIRCVRWVGGSSSRQCRPEAQIPSNKVTGGCDWTLKLPRNKKYSDQGQISNYEQ